MALWRIVVKNSGNAACKDKRQRLEKGMFIETSTVSPIPPIGVARERPMLAQLFLNKYGIEVNVQNMNSGYFNCEKIGWWLKLTYNAFDFFQIHKKWLLRKITSSDHCLFGVQSMAFRFYWNLSCDVSNDNNECLPSDGRCQSSEAMIGLGRPFLHLGGKQSEHWCFSIHSQVVSVNRPWCQCLVAIDQQD